MDHLLVLLLLCSSGVQAEEKHNSESDDVRLVGGASHCAGTLELKHLGEWRVVDGYAWTLKHAAIVCQLLDCGSAVSVEWRIETPNKSVWEMEIECIQSGSAVRDCVTSDSSPVITNVTCADSVRLLNGSSLCSGRLEVKSNQSWSSVCEADFDQQDAEVVCRELGCGPPSVLQGALYGEVEAPVWSKEFQCGGHESALLDCRSSGSARNSCSLGKAVGLTCSEPDDVRMVGGANPCAGILELKHLGEWRPMYEFGWTLKDAAPICEHLDCGSAVSLQQTKSSLKFGWRIKPDCVKSRSTLRECTTSGYYNPIMNLTCSDSVRLLNGSSLCSGRLEVKSNQSWSSVCEADFDQQDAEVVCRELGCGPPSVLQAALYGEVEAPVWSKAFQCGGHESALLDCRSSGSARNSCSPGKAVGLTCSESDDVRLVGGASRCAGSLELKLGEWRPVEASEWILGKAAVICEHLHCGSLDYVEARNESLLRSVWRLKPDCVQSGSALRECATSEYSLMIMNFTCSDLLIQPNIHAFSMDGVSEAQQQGLQVSSRSNFTISCSIQPQYPGGSFQLTFTSSNTTYSYTQPAVNHSAHFLFPAAEPVHQGNYSCVYHIYVFSHNFSSESRLLSVAISDSADSPAPTASTVHTITGVVLLLILLIVITALYFSWKASRELKLRRKENTDVVYYNYSDHGAEGGSAEDESHRLKGAHLKSK
uniref:SRCR domain-containing protein n=1 Tax=Oreochromis aureus TaxID=47969 RepID=A0AAZ1WXD3_OREAU